jgi:hypothetical protein
MDISQAILTRNYVGSCPCLPTHNSMNAHMIEQIRFRAVPMIFSFFFPFVLISSALDEFVMKAGHDMYVSLVSEEHREVACSHCRDEKDSKVETKINLKLSITHLLMDQSLICRFT